MTTSVGSAKGESGPTQTVVAGERWNAKPRLAMVVGVSLRLLPILVGTLAVWAATRLLPRPSGWWIVAWWFGLVVIAQGTVWSLNRWTARLLPMSMLLRLSLVFPDKAPSRVATALRSGNVEKLNREVTEAIDNGLPVEINEAIRTALSMVRTLSTHDKGTRGHSERVRAYSEVIAEELGLSVEIREKVRWGAILHDIGKLSVPSEILNLPGRPSPEQWDILRRHPGEGARMLAPLADWLGDAFHACDHHHERWDGKGYPYGLAGDAISLTGRIVSVADAFAVMTMARSYKKPYSIDVARRELLKGAGSQFDPTVVRAMLAVSVGRMNRIAGPLAAFANVPLIGPLLGPIVAPVVTFAPSVPSFVRAGAVALMTTSAGVTPLETRPVPWQSEVTVTLAPQSAIPSSTVPDQLALQTPSGLTSTTSPGKRATDATIFTSDLGAVVIPSATITTNTLPPSSTGVPSRSVIKSTTTFSTGSSAPGESSASKTLNSDYATESSLTTATTHQPIRELVLPTPPSGLSLSTSTVLSVETSAPRTTPKPPATSTTSAPTTTAIVVKGSLPDTKPPLPETKPPRPTTTPPPTDTTPPIIATTTLSPKETTPPPETKPPLPAPTIAATLPPTTSPSSETTPPPTTTIAATTIPSMPTTTFDPTGTKPPSNTTTTAAAETKPPKTPPLATTTTEPASETK